MLFPIKVNENETRERVLTNIVKMLTSRKLIKEKNMDSTIKKITTTESEDMIYKIPVDVFTSDDNKEYIIKIYPQKINAISKSSGIYDFLITYKKNPKIVIVTYVANRALETVMKHYKNTEFFIEQEMMINIIDHILIPKHELLSDKETASFYETYNAKKKNIAKIFVVDPVAKYYNMKIGQICRITRPSETTGYVNSYKLVVKGR
jgi:DNA-directed RNA polymerase I, II, and III subunit RPABC1